MHTPAPSLTNGLGLSKSLVSVPQKAYRKNGDDSDM